MGIRIFAAAASALLLSACATSIPKDTVFTAAAEDAILVLPNATGHVLLTSVDPLTETANGVFEEYLPVSGKQYAVQRVPAGTYIFTSHSFYFSEMQPLKFECLSRTAPVFEVKAGKVNFAPMVDPGRWNGQGPRIDKATATAMTKEALALYPNIDAPVEEASMVAVGTPMPAKGFGCMKDTYQTLFRTQDMPGDW